MFIYNSVPAGIRISRGLHLEHNVRVELLQQLLIHFHSIIMADSKRIVFPDEVADIKAAAADAKKDVGGETNTIDAVPEEVTITSRNMVQVPSNCPDGYKMGADGVCREVFD